MAVEPAAASARIDQVRDGVFFTLPEALPRGRHGLTREQVTSAQRERMLVAMTELLAAHGYRGFGAAEIVGRAGVSLAAFYDCFENKDACVFAGYDRFIEVLLNRLTAIEPAGKDPATLVKEVVEAYLHALQGDPVVARAYVVEIDGLGARARERRRESLTPFATYIRELTTRVAGGQPPPQVRSETVYIGVVYAVRQLVADALDTEAEPDLIGMAEDLEVWLSDLFRVA